MSILKRTLSNTPFDPGALSWSVNIHRIAVSTYLHDLRQQTYKGSSYFLNSDTSCFINLTGSFGRLNYLFSL